MLYFYLVSICIFFRLFLKEIFFIGIDDEKVIFNGVKIFFFYSLNI